MVGGLDSLEYGFRLLSAFEKISEWILASATTLLGAGALAVFLFCIWAGRGLLLLGCRGHGARRGDVQGREGGREDGWRVVDGGAEVVPDAGGESDGESAGGDKADGVEDGEVVGQPRTVVVGHNQPDELEIQSKVLSISDPVTSMHFINVTPVVFQ